MSVEQANINFNGDMRFILPKNFLAEISGQCQSAQLFGLYRLHAFGSLDVGIKKKLPGKLSSLAFNGTNILNTNVIKFSTDLPKQNLVNSATLRFFVPTFRLTCAHNFGIIN